ncbi:hypothetical protein PtA15_2A389 [Puccinia triticina]|uniref:Uncharacterized protein n=1 Tax=Puccinia triticina TaxID=208348 RepID=A0ABY7CD68_9BASI|nr:uncharacterized protein PtA15_2A389 [Puccinia triticina]WAQ82076.1 hypothetical protein PtA15_2A389 [Puccinia triticina]
MSQTQGTTGSQAAKSTTSQHKQAGKGQQRGHSPPDNAAPAQVPVDTLAPRGTKETGTTRHTTTAIPGGTIEEGIFTRGGGPHRPIMALGIVAVTRAHLSDHALARL